MKKSLQLLCLAIALALIPAAVLVAGDLPPDSGEFVQKKYSGWSGVLRGWISSRWEADGSFIRWLNACATEFEKNHEGVYLEFTQVAEDAMRRMATSGIRMPDLVFFSPGVLEDGSNLLPADPPEPLLPDLQKTGGRCFPVAMGGYIWACNRSLCGGAPVEPSRLDLYPSDEPGRCFSAAAVALLSGEASSGEINLPDPGIDLGLPAISGIQAKAFDSFLRGELPCLPVTQKEIARLVRLRDSGKGPDWFLEPGGSFALADQLLLCGAVDTGEPERQDLAREFAAFLCREENQRKLADIAAIPVTGAQAYGSRSPYAQLAALMQTRRLLIRNPFSEYSNPNFEAIVRDFKNGACDAASALGRMGFPIEG